MTDLDQRAELDSRAPEQANEMLRLVGRRASAEIQRTSSRPAEIASRAPGKAAEHERRDTKTTETKTEQQVLGGDANYLRGFLRLRMRLMRSPIFTLTGSGCPLMMRVTLITLGSRRGVASRKEPLSSKSMDQVPGGGLEDGR